MLVTPVWFVQGIVMATKKLEAARAAIATVAAPVAGPAAAKKSEPAAALSGTESQSCQRWRSQGEKKGNAKMIDEGKKGEADGTAEELQREAKEKEAGQGMPEAKEKKDKAEEERGEKEKKRGEAKEKTVADEEKKDEAKEDAAERPPFPAGMHCTIRPLHPPPPTLALPFGRESNSNGAFPSLPLHLACHNNSRLPFCRDNAALQLVAG